MLKKVLCVDLGDVLVQFEEKYLKVLVRKEKFAEFITVYHEYDMGSVELFDLHKKFLSGNFYKEPVSWGKFIQAYDRCLYDVHTPMFMALSELKARGVELICVTDNNPFCFYTTCVKFPGVAELFHRDNKEQWMLSYKFGVLKRGFLDGQGSLFTRLPSEFGYSFKEMAFVDNLPINIEKAAKAGFSKSACFLYDRFDPKNHLRFLKFLDFHFPVK